MFTFADSFDMYATLNDMGAGYWDSVAGSSVSPVAGRFTGQCLQFNAGGGWNATKVSNANDAVHHFVLAFRQSSALTGTSVGINIQLFDSATAQCTLSFRSDGALLLQSGSLGATLATYAGAVNATNVWIAFEIEVVIHNTAGSITVRKNGNTSNDFTVGSLNTRGGTANNYANKILLNNTGNISSQLLDDLLWRSDPTSVAWMGDIRAYVRMPASDASVQFAKSQAVAAITPFTLTSSVAVSSTVPRYSAFTPTFDSVLNTVSLVMTAGYTGNMKCSLFASSGSAPTTVLASATPISNPVTGANTFTFPTAPALARNTQYWLGWASDTASGTYSIGNGVSGINQNGTLSYGSFPVASPTITTGTGPELFTANTALSNFALVNETLQDGTTTYVYDATVGHGDLYNIAAASPTPTSVVAVTTRGFIEKSDAGARSGAVQLKSGVTTAQSTSTPLASSFSWLYRIDSTDPNTGSAWTPAAVDALQIGQVVTA